MSTPSVVITGLGAASPLGLNTEQLWEGLLNGRCGIDRISAFDPVKFPCQIAGQVPDYKIRDFIPKTYRKAAKLMSRDIELTVIAALDAVTNSGWVTQAIDPDKVTLDPTRTAIILGAGLISCDLEELAPSVAASITDGEFDLKKYGQDGLPLVTPLWLLKYLPNMLACHVSILHDIQGPSNTITCAESSGLLAVAEATQIIQRGSSDVALAGGAEAKVNPIVYMRQCLTDRATNQCNDNPTQACRPFDATATGSVFGEAGGVLVLEKADLAQQRGARIYAEIAGIGQSSCINKDFSRLEPEAKGITIAVEKALQAAGITADHLDLIIPHGTGVPADDLAEAKAIQKALGNAASDIPVWCTKGLLSNTGAAAGALDLIAASLAMQNNTIPASGNVSQVAEGCDLNIVTETQERSIRYALCCSYTYGGQTAAVVLKRR